MGTLESEGSKDGYFKPGRLTHRLAVCKHCPVVACEAWHVRFDDGYMDEKQ